MLLWQYGQWRQIKSELLHVKFSGRIMGAYTVNWIGLYLPSVIEEAHEL